MPFSVAKTRYLKSGSNGLVAIHLSHDFESARKSRGLTNCAEVFLSAGVQCVLVGLDDLADQILQKCREWLIDAIEHTEGARREIMAFSSFPCCASARRPRSREC